MYWLPPELAEKLSALKIGAPLAMADLRVSIQRLYATGRYESIEVDAQETDDGVVLTFNTKPARLRAECHGSRGCRPP